MFQMKEPLRSGNETMFRRSSLIGFLGSVSGLGTNIDVEMF